MNRNFKTIMLVTLVAFGLGCGYSSSKTTTTTMTPAINQLNPGSVTHGSAQFQLEVDGMNFASNGVVNFNKVAVSTTFVSSGKLEATIPASAVMTAGTASVTVTNPGSGGIYGTPPVTSAAMSFTID